MLRGNSFKPVPSSLHQDVSNDSLSVGTNDRQFQRAVRAPSPIPFRGNQSETGPRMRDPSPIKNTTLRSRDHYSPIRQKVNYDTLNPEVDHLGPADRFLYDALSENFDVLCNRFRIIDLIEELGEPDRPENRRWAGEKVKAFEKSVDVLKRSVLLRAKLQEVQALEDANLNEFCAMWEDFGAQLENNMIKNVDMDRNTVLAIYDKHPQSLIDDTKELIQTLPHFLNELEQDTRALSNRLQSERAKKSQVPEEPIDRRAVEAERQRVREHLLGLADLLI